MKDASFDIGSVVYSFR